MILVYTRASDTHADKVLDALAGHGAPTYRFDTDDLARGTARVHLDEGSGCRSYLINGAGQRLRLSEVRCAWLWKYVAFSPPAELGQEARGRQATAIRLLSHAIGRHLRRQCPVINDVDRQAAAADRVRQLRVAAHLGLSVPATLVSNCSAALQAFAGDHTHLAVKLTASMPRPPLVAGPMVWTQRLERGDLPGAAAVQLCPGIFQPYVAKRYELRITIVGGRAFAAKIHSQREEHTRVDFRRYVEHGDSICTQPHELTRSLETRLIDLTRELGLTYGAADVIVTPRGETVFLEINPQGTYDWLDATTHQRITTWLAHEIVNRRAGLRARSERSMR